MEKKKHDLWVWLDKEKGNVIVSEAVKIENIYIEKNTNFSRNQLNNKPRFFLTRIKLYD